MSIRVLVVLAVALVCGCATTSSSSPRKLKVDVPVPTEVTFRYTDARNKSEEPSLFQLSPSPSEVFRAWLFHSMADELRGRSVRLDSFTIGAIDVPYDHRQPPAFNALDQVFGGKTYFVTITGKVGEFDIYVHENERGSELYAGAVLNSLLERARRSLLMKVSHAVRVS